jgi:hypothetical protein
MERQQQAIRIRYAEPAITLPSRPLL